MIAKDVILNCDLGEGLDNDHLIMPYIQACNLACGGHAGDTETMKRVVDLALKYRVFVGAHPSYPDRKNFGRVSMKLSKNELVASVRKQIDTLVEVLNEKGALLHHIKPHGALYNDITANEELGRHFLEAVELYRDSVALYLPYGTRIVNLARDSGFKVHLEAFADRSYNKDHSLVSRTLANAVLTDPLEVLAHMKRMIFDAEVMTITGELIPMHAKTYCVHSDTESALDMLSILNKDLCSS